MNSKEVDTLIELVRTNSALYDRAHALHNNQNHIKDIWNGIAEELDHPVKKVRDKWKNLRDSYRSQLYRKQESMENETPLNESSWPYYQQMSFLEDHMQGRSKSITPGGKSLKRERDESGDDNSVCVSKLGNSTSLNHIEMVTVDDFDPSVLHHLGYQESETPTKRSRLETIQEEDKCFFDSLLPYMKRLSPRDKMLCRMRIQEVIFSIAFPKTEAILDHSS